MSGRREAARSSTTNDIEGYCRYRHLLIGEVFSDIDFSALRGARPPSLDFLKRRRRKLSADIVPSSLVTR